MDKKTPAAGGPGTPKKKALNDTSGLPSVSQMGQLAAAAGSIPRPRFDDGITMELFRYCTCASVYSDSWDENSILLSRKYAGVSFGSFLSEHRLLKRLDSEREEFARSYAARLVGPFGN